MEAVITALAEAIKSVYVDSHPEDGELTELFYQNKARHIIDKYPEIVLPMLKAFDQLKESVKIIE